MQSLWRTLMELAANGVGFDVVTLRNESLIQRGRNRLVADFMAREFTHLMFIDSDIEWHPSAIGLLLSRRKQVICGAYPKKELPISYVVNAPDAKVENGLVEVRDAGTGFMLVHRSVFETVQQAHPELKYDDYCVDIETEYGRKFNDNSYDLFEPFIEDGDFDPALGRKRRRLLSEDYAFCRRWQRCGGKVWLDPAVKLNHVGAYTFEGDVGKALEAINHA